MLRLDPELHAHLESGGTLAVASRQRAVAVQLAYAAARLAAGATTWSTPDVLTVQALLAREGARGRHAAGRRQLTPAEEWALWRRAALETAGSLPVLSAPALADVLLSNRALIGEWGLEAQVLPGPEGDWMRRASRRYQALQAQLNASDSLSWREEAQALPGSVWLGHPEWLGGALRESLLARGARLLSDADPAAGNDVASHSDTGPGDVTVIEASTGDAELEQMACWARRRLAADPGARLLLVIPTLSLEINSIERFLSEQLDEMAIAEGNASIIVHALEGGQPLADSPFVQVALGAVRMAVGPVPFEDWSAVLRSVSLGEVHAAARLQLELGGRADGLQLAGWIELAHYARRQAAVDRGWLDGLATELRAWPGEDLPSQWARRYAALWSRLGWPGERTLTSGDLQRRQRFDELLGEFASLDDVLGALSADDAAAQLAQWVQRARFEPASGDAAVTVTARLEDPLVHYDGVWVARMTAENWPRPPEAGGFVAATALQAAGQLQASADGQLALARHCMHRWRMRTAQLIYSWARLDGEAKASASPLLAGLPARPSEPETAAVRGGLLQVGPAPEGCGVDRARPWHRTGRTRGGIGLLQAQSQCPFKATARWRLECEPLEEPVAGVDPRLHGEVLHAALAQLWTEIGDSATLAQRPAAGWSDRVAASVSAAIDRLRAGRGWLVEPLAWVVEQRRCERALQAALALERERPPFRVIAREQAAALQLGALELGVRLDRVDALVAGEGAGPGSAPVTPRILIDYKSGKKESTDFESMRPNQVQLQAYAQLVDAVQAVATLHLHRAQPEWAGVAAAAVRLGKLKSAPGGWDELRRRWQAMLHGLAEQFVDGRAEVDPLEKACQHCGLQLLCRVDAEVLADRLAAADEADD